MGRPRVKVIDSAVDLEKAEKVKDEETKLTQESEEKVEKQAKTAKKSVVKKNKKPRSRSKRYEDLRGKIDKSKEYDLSEAVEIIKKTSNTKFESSVEIHVNLNTDQTKSDQLIRKTINLPNASGKILRVLVFGGNSKELKTLGAEVGTEATLEKINSGKVDVDKIVATSEWMPKLTKAAKVLGPKGLMPNPKSGTVTEKPEQLMKSFQGGMIEVKSEKEGIIHLTIGKVSSPEKKIEENVKVIVYELRQSKPASLKKELIRSVYLSSSMGPGVRLSLPTLK